MSWTRERARVARLTQTRTPDDPDLLEARRNLKAERLADYVRNVVDAAPPLNDSQRSMIAALLKPGGRGAAA